MDCVLIKNSILLKCWCRKKVAHIFYIYLGNDWNIFHMIHELKVDFLCTWSRILSPPFCRSRSYKLHILNSVCKIMTFFVWKVTPFSFLEILDYFSLFFFLFRFPSPWQARQGRRLAFETQKKILLFYRRMMQLNRLICITKITSPLCFLKFRIFFS